MIPRYVRWKSLPTCRKARNATLYLYEVYVPYGEYVLISTQEIEPEDYEHDWDNVSFVGKFEGSISGPIVEVFRESDAVMIGSQE